MPKSFGAYIRELRERRNMTLEDVAKKSGVHISTISRMERNDSDPTLFGTLMPISAALGMRVDSLLRNHLKQLGEHKHAKR